MTHDLIDVPPRSNLATSPKLKSAADVAAALEWLSYIKSRTETIQGQAQQQIDLIKAGAAKKLVLDVGKQRIPFADREATLRQAIEDYVSDNADTFFDGETKLRKFPYGDIQQIAQRPTTGYIPGSNDKSVVEKLEGATGLLSKIERLLTRIKWHGIPLWDLINLSIKPRLTGFRDALETEAATKTDLKSVGIVVTQPSDKIKTTVADYVLQTETAGA